jgi:hypothetical protein
MEEGLAMLSVAISSPLWKAHVVANIDVLVQNRSLQGCQGWCGECRGSGWWLVAGGIVWELGAKLDGRGWCIYHMFKWVGGKGVFVGMALATVLIMIQK